MQNFKAGLIHLLRDEGYRGLTKIENFLWDLLRGEKEGLLENLRRWRFDDVDEEMIFREVTDLILDLSIEDAKIFSKGKREYFAVRARILRTLKKDLERRLASNKP